MTTKTFLNALRQKDRRLPEPVPGRWKPYDKFLVDYAADISIQGVAEDRRGMANVPSVFARPIYFAQVLADERHPSFRAVLGQWRGLLATFALSDWLGLSLAVHRIGVPANPEAEPAGARALWTILRSQLPRPEEEWDHWWLLLCDGRSLGATSPWTVVYTPAEYSCPATIPWQHNGTLIDPRAHYDPKGVGRSVELSRIAAWLDKVIAGDVSAWGVVGRNHLNGFLQVVARRLAEWRCELESYRQEAHAGLAWENSTRIGEAPYARFLGSLKGTSSPGGDDTTQSDLLLKSSRGGEVLALSRSGLAAGQRVYGPILVNDIDFGKLKSATGTPEWRTRTGKLVPVPYVIAEEAFLPPKLAQVSIDGAGWGTGGNRLATPLTALFFRYFTAKDVVGGRVRLEVSEEAQRIHVRLWLPLSSGELVVEKSYDRDADLVGTVEETPALAHWPDFFDPAWRHHYAVLVEDNPAAALTAAPLPWVGEPLQRSRSEGEKALRIWASPQPIVGFVLYEGDEEKMREAGVILRRTFRNPQPRNETLRWRVAVDFGTSNTNVLVEESNGIRPLALAGRTTLLTAPGSQPAREAAANDFLPVEAVMPPFPTLLLRDDASILGAERAQKTFTVRFRSLNDKLSLRSLVQNVKWSSGGTAEDNPLRDYLNYLLRCIVCEAWAAGVSTLRFEWSYPLSLSATGRGAMSGFWQAAAGAFTAPAEAGGRRIEIQAEPGTSESVALCRYLYQAKALEVGAGALSIAVDIGGGSSDVGIWRSKILRDQLSMKVAGNDVLSGFANSEQFVAEIQRICEPAPQNWRPQDDFLRQPAALFNSLLVKAQPARGSEGAIDPDAHPVAQALAGMDLHRAEYPWQGVRSLIYLFGFGLSFYLGLHARRWMKDVDLNEVKVGFAGRGASLFSWVAMGKTLEPMLAAAFAEGLALGEEGTTASRVDIALPGGSGKPSSRLKQETAHGLLDRHLASEAVERENSTIAGEVNWMDEFRKPLDWKAEITADMLPHLLPPSNHESGYMAHLVTNVLPRFAEELALDRQGLARLRVSSSRVQNLLTFPDDKLVVVQPLFAYELTALMETYLDNYLKDRSGRS